jgi:hypothetical protein
MFSRNEKRISSQEPLRMWFWSLCGICVLCLFSYGYLVRGAIVNIVARQNIESEVSVLNSKVLDLESEYIKAKNNITPELATSLGFVAVSNQKFVTKDVKTPGLSLVTSGN